MQQLNSISELQEDYEHISVFHHPKNLSSKVKVPQKNHPNTF